MARYIDADKLCDSLRESYNRLFELYKKAKDNDAATICEAELNTFMECIIRTKIQPTADVVEEKHGEWIVHAWDGEDYCIIPFVRGQHTDPFCSLCKEPAMRGSRSGVHEASRYCPNCGAKMDVTDTNVGSK